MQLIKIDSTTIGTEVKETVNARELWEFLESKRQFADWMKERIELYGFAQGVDFVQFHKKVNGSVKPLTEYHLTLDMAKEICMVERNEKGKQARQYFIECERRAKNPLAALEDPAAMRTLLLGYAEKVLERDKLISHLQPQAAALHRISLADGSLCITDAAKTLGIQPQKVLIPYLRANKWIYNRTGCAHPIAYQDKLQQMLLEHKVTTVNRTDGSEKITEQVRITPKGLTKLAQIFGVM